ncbi:MAG: carbon-nitrogen hydrolase family protein [Candidatus Melainabacteria bacterium]|jgi:deaminated glutathione amidase|nr:carbon-nitrogen hydrolase family protein [Candidatus Melainabacteria bacterium]
MKIAAIQINAGSNKAENLAKIEDYVNRAQADFIALPEVCNYRGGNEATLSSAESFEDSETIKLIQKLALKKKSWILIGSLMLQAEGLPFNSSILISPQGLVTARYDKIHLFDMNFKGQQIRESSKSQAGLKPVIAQVNKLKLGMSICYDLRFPELYRHYAKERVELISVPSSFTKITGEAHWHCLLRARAIENQAFVIAPNQGGDNQGVKSYGHSMIIDPWGKILAEAGEEETIIYADLDMDELGKVRAKLPVLDHIRL